MGASPNLLTDFEQRNTPPTLRHPSSAHTISILTNNWFNILSVGSVLLQSTDGYICILKFIYYLFLKSGVHIAQYVILILLIFYVLRLFECFREKYYPGKCVIRTTLTQCVVFQCFTVHFSIQ